MAQNEAKKALVKDKHASFQYENIFNEETLACSIQLLKLPSAKKTKKPQVGCIYYDSHPILAASRDSHAAGRNHSHTGVATEGTSNVKQSMGY